MSDNEDVFAGLLKSLSGRASDAGVREAGASFDVCLRDTLVLVQAGEPAVAAEMLVSNLYEYDVALQPDEQDLLRELVEALPVQTSTTQTLRLLTHRV